MTDEKLWENKLRVAILRGAQLMTKHGLGHWKMKLVNRKRNIAQTDYMENSIIFNQRFIRVSTEEQFVGIALHEIAHALVGIGHGHDGVFKQMCSKISPNNDYVNSRTTVLIGDYTLTCPSCGSQGSVNKDNDRYCSACWSASRDWVKMDRKKNKLEIRTW